MKNTLDDLANYLFASIEEIMDAETTEEIEVAIKKGKAISNISAPIINVAGTKLKAAQMLAEYGKSALPDIELIGSHEKVKQIQ